MATNIPGRNPILLLTVAILATALGSCGESPAELEELNFRAILHQSDRTLERGPLIQYLNQSHGPEADRLINQGMVRWAAAHRNQWPPLMVRLKMSRIDGITKAAEELSP